MEVVGEERDFESVVMLRMCVVAVEVDVDFAAVVL